MTSLSAALLNRQNYLIQRQGAISGNIANVNTPNYLAKDVVFNKMVQGQQGGLQAALTHSKHLRGGGGQAMAHKMTESKAGMTLDGNSVVLEDEMLKLNETQLNYRMVTQLYSKHASFQRLVIGRNQ